MFVCGSNVTVAAWPLAHEAPEPSRLAAWKKRGPICVVTSPGSPCCISTEAIVPLVNCTLSTVHSPSLAPMSPRLPAKT
jgi:hypothetical protein